MDASKPQPDENNESDSLEGTGTVVEADASTPASSGASTDAPSSVNADAPKTSATQQPAKKSFVKQIWAKFNIYLLLFILVILVAIGVTVGLFLKNRSDTKKTESVIKSQSLSDSALKQLANSDVTVGNSRQILKVESNAVFGGSVLVRNDLEVAGTVKIGNELQLPGITVSGSSRFNQLQADNLNIGSNAIIQGTLTAKRGINASGTSSFDNISAAQISTNAFILNGDLKLTNHITAGGPNPGIAKGNALGNGGTTSVSGSDTTGSLIVNTGSSPSAGCFATITFAKKFSGTPHVIVTPIGSAAAGISYYVNRNSSEFSVCTTTPASAGQTFGFDYVILN